MKEFLSVSEVAERLNLSERAVWMRVYRRQLPFTRLGKRVLVSVSELNLYLAGLPGVSAAEAIAKAEAAAR